MTKKKKKSRIYIIWLMNLCLITTVVAFFVWYESVPDVSPEKVLKTYMAHISNREYEQMYEMIDAGISGNISQENFVKRNSAIYEGIDVDNMKVHITSYDKEQKEICYETSMDTVAGNVTFENKASFILEKGKYKLIWNDSLIFPELDSTDKVKVSTTSAKRGQIIDRNGHLLAGEGVASSIGVVPGKLENKNDAISQLAELLEMKTEDIEKKLAAKWVKDDSFVPFLKNALIYSDNIYFAKAALKIGENDMESSLTKLGFNDVLPFDIKMAKSQFSNTEKIEKEVQLADSGYGQGQILVNPLHMACMYSAFCNEGNMIKPYLTYKEDAMPDVWIKEAFTKDVAQTVLEDTKEVINNPHGTGYAAHRTDIILAGKTGTAEIKASKDDTTGTELGWFSVFTTDENMERPIMIVSMVEDVKGRGGSGYVVKKDSQVLEKWFSGN